MCTLYSNKYTATLPGAHNKNPIIDSIISCLSVLFCQCVLQQGARVHSLIYKYIIYIYITYSAALYLLLNPNKQHQISHEPTRKGVIPVCIHVSRSVYFAMSK
jgi:hypothetical protein